MSSATDPLAMLIGVAVENTDSDCGNSGPVGTVLLSKFFLSLHRNFIHVTM